MRMKYWMLALASTFLLSFQAVAQNVAKIGDTPYAILQAALDAAVAGDTITLLADVTCTEKPVFSKGGIVNVDVNGHVFVSTEQARVRNVASADGVVPSNNIKFVSGFGWEVYSPNTTEGVNFRVFPTLDAVIAYEPAKPNPARIYPYENVKQDKDVVLRKYGHGTSSTICIDPEYDITWDLNGYTVLQESPTGNPLEACVRGKFTLKDSSAEQTGKWIAGACGVTNPESGWYGNGGPALYVLGEGEAVLEGGTISIARNATLDTAGNEIVNSGGLIRVDGGKLDVHGATLQVDDTYGVMAWGGEIEINAGAFDIDPEVSVPVYAVGYYEDVAVEVNSTFDGALCVYGNVAGYQGASAMVNAAGVEYATGSGWVVPSVGEGLMTFNGLVLEEGIAVVKSATSVKSYATFADALDAAQAGDTIVLLADVTCTEKPVFSKGGIVNVDVNGHVFVSTEQARVRNVVSADGAVPSNNIKFVSGFGWEVYAPNTTEGVNFRVFPTLDAVMAYEPAKPNPARIYPYEDVKQDKDVVLRKYGHGTSSTICIDPEYDITWDLNGYTVRQESPTGNPLEACVRGKFTLKDSSAEQTGKWIAGACGVTNPESGWYGNGGPALYVLGKGEVILEGGTISIARNATPDTAGNEIVNSGGLIRVDGGKLNVNGATLQVDDTYGVMAWGGEIEINAGTFDIDPTVSVPVYAVGYYEDVAVEVNSTFDGALCVYGNNIAGYKGASATVNVAGIEYATGSGWFVPSVGEGLMTFNGLVLEEGIVVVKSATSVKSYATFADALDAAQAGDTIELFADIAATEVILLDKNLTINGNGHKVTSSATRVFRVTTANTEVTLNNVNMVSTAERVGQNDVRGISIDNVNGVKLTLNDCSVDFTDASANDWAYAVNQSGKDSSGNTITIIGGTYEGANVINVYGANHTVTVTGATLTSNYPNADVYYGAGIWVEEEKGSSVEATGNTFNGSNAVAFNLGTGTTLTESNNTDNTTRCVAKIGDIYYTTFAAAAEAAAAGQEVTLLVSPTADANNVVTASTAGATLEAAKAYEVAKLLGGEFKKTTEGTLQYAYEFGVSYITYDPTNAEKPIVLVAKLEEGEVAAANRDLTGRFLVVTVTQKSNGASTKYMVENPVLDADGKITVNLPLVDDQSGQGVLFCVSVTDEAPDSATVL